MVPKGGTSVSYDSIIRKYSKPLEPVPIPFSQEGSLSHVVRAVLFDVYGTLFVSKAGDISVAETEAGLNLPEIEGLLHRYGIGLPAGEILERFFAGIVARKTELQEGGIDYPEVVIEDIWSATLGVDDRELLRRFALEYELIVNPVYPMPHLRELLHACRVRRLPMGIISNAQFYTPFLFSALLDTSLDELGFVENFMFFSYRLGYGKPSPRMFDRARSALGKAGIESNNVLFVGNDMLKDIWPASQAGFQTALFAGDGRSLNLRKNDERCGNVRPDVTVTGLLQIVDYL